MISLTLCYITLILLLYLITSITLLLLSFQKRKILNLPLNLDWSVCAMYCIKFSLANRLKKILPNIITENQSAFTKIRLISDNILVVFESLHSMQKHTGKDGYMAIKLDMSKAYNRVEWDYLSSVMEKMGFKKYWICLMMLCVKTVTYSILVNGEPKGMITPTKTLDKETHSHLSYSCFASRD